LLDGSFINAVSFHRREVIISAGRLPRKAEWRSSDISDSACSRLIYISMTQVVI